MERQAILKLLDDMSKMETFGFRESLIPERFSRVSDDQLMNQIIMFYAIEKKNGLGVPTGEFYVNKPAAYVIARVIIRKFMPGIDID
mgnify:CR=1 FL=1